MEEDELTDRKKLAIGLTAIVLGIVTTIAASVFVHGAESPLVDTFGRDLYPIVPRGWVPATIGQLVAVGGALLAVAGATFAFVYDRQLTWARAAVGAALFTGLLLILFAVIPNQWVTLAQSSLEWTPQKVFVTIPPALVLGNEMSVSYKTLQEIIAGTYPVVMLAVIATVMVKWQTRSRTIDKPKPTPVSSFGRPMRDGPGFAPAGEAETMPVAGATEHASQTSAAGTPEPISAFGRPMRDGPG